MGVVHTVILIGGISGSVVGATPSIFSYHSVNPAHVKLMFVKVLKEGENNYRVLFLLTGIVTIHFKCLYCKRQKREKMTCEREQFFLSKDSI